MLGTFLRIRVEHEVLPGVLGHGSGDRIVVSVCGCAWSMRTSHTLLHKRLGGIGLSESRDISDCDDTSKCSTIVVASESAISSPKVLVRVPPLDVQQLTDAHAPKNSVQMKHSAG